MTSLFEFSQVKADARLIVEGAEGGYALPGSAWDEAVLALVEVTEAAEAYEHHKVICCDFHCTMRDGCAERERLHARLVAALDVFEFEATG